MSRYRETECEKGLESVISSLDEILDLVEEAKRKTSSKSVHSVLDQIINSANINRTKAFNIFQKINDEHRNFK